MAEETTGTEAAQDGQNDAGQVETPVTDAAPADAAGQLDGTNDGAPDDGHQPTDDTETIYDPAELKRLTGDLDPKVKAQVEALTRNLQGSFTKKTQALAAERKKIEAYDAANQDPLAFARSTAERYGYNLVQAGNGGTQDQGQGEGWNPEAGDPESWNDVVAHVKSQIMGDMQGQLNPIIGEFQRVKQESIEKQLTDIDPGWQTHEDAMMANLHKHPTLAQDAASLYRMSVPQNLLESRATQAALAKVAAKTKSASVAGNSTTKQAGPSRPEGPMSLKDAVAAAKVTLREQGITPG